MFLYRNATRKKVKVWGSRILHLFQIESSS